uniref:Probable ATP-dependent transporter ycf16 n=1 Tax=Mastocarpus papillatus TaxID=31436 RepID=A0A342RZM6_9FLOR|nr:iron-sulfur cluster formation ABC transporter ATP-binding subunit [Mastocarpus papillatus]AOL58172.1 iron-sulfur cluster formation ABC transporter ATP-binding subunit [Mastocarpus papillatus]
MSNNLLDISNLYTSIDNIEILKGLNLTINSGEIHAIMGKNGSGKSTLAKVIAGHPSYHITQGNIIFNGQNINNLDPVERSLQGIFLAFQYPVEISGVSNADFLRLAYNERQKADNKIPLDPLSFLDLINQKIKLIDMKPTFLSRNVNDGFSGGEKKKNEILQMTLLNTKLAILDETDSGLDIDALKIISANINALASNNNATIIITHYKRLLEYIVPDYIHIMKDGKIVYTGDASIAKKLEQYGYDSII